MGVGLQPFVHPLTQSEGHRVVVGDEVVLDDAAAPEQRRRPSRIDRTGAWRRRVVEEAAIEVARIGAEIPDVGGAAGPQFPLNVDAPLILARVGQMARRRDHVGSRRRADGAGGMLERQCGIRGI